MNVLSKKKFDLKIDRNFIAKFCYIRDCPVIYVYTRHAIIFTPSSLVFVQNECSVENRARRPRIDSVLARLAFCTSNFANVERASELDRRFRPHIFWLRFTPKCEL